MPRSPLILLLALLALAPAALVATGCGADDVDPVSAAQAAERTREARTARVVMRVLVRGAGQDVRVTGRGVTALDRAEADLTLDLAPVLTALGVGGDGATRLLLTGGDLFVDPPEVRGAQLPRGADWVRVRLPDVAEGLGADPEGLAPLFRLDTASWLESLRAAGELEEVGQEEVGGVPTTHLRGRLSLRDYLRTLPADRRRAAERALRQLDPAGAGDQEDAVDVWVDEQGLLRRIVQRTRTPAAQGAPALSVEVVQDFSDFGARLDVEPPARGDTFDATRVLTDLAAGSAGGARAGR